ncbi:hypothetical protein EUX98_g827 [Antrodiella citrinella]|uniref:SGNH hydrolase-type esterase domain-containing protein n=1 Tax=Antrodiella citrinella TaxID=2447956 RepID=A0A4S4N618_9APHY|nr:hypothetical protein EUX98_g827 [Antrodiella citrinella]
MLFQRLLSAFASSSAVAHAITKGPTPSQIKNLVTFGDSFSDVVQTGDHATAWPVYAADYGHYHLFPYAKYGAPCSTKQIQIPYPSLLESQIPSYEDGIANGSLSMLHPDDTMYTLWIGANDIGGWGLLTGEAAQNVTLVDIVQCTMEWVEVLYKSGARYFLFQNLPPLEHTINYGAVSYPNLYWTAQRNQTDWHLTMTQYVAAGNELSSLMLKNLASTLPDIHIGLFDSYKLISDMLAHPQDYLNGTAPVNTTGAIHSCVYELNESTSDTGNCTIVTGSDVDSYLWYDEVHPSEQTDRIIARELVAGIERRSDNWTTWFS